MPAATVPLPAQIGRYRITGVIGRGGMGMVFRGHDDALARDVAVKVIHDRFSSTANVIRRFGAEARSVARLSSPHIVHVHEFDPLADPPFLAMELVQGPSLQRLIRDHGRASCATVVECARQVLAGLAAAHAAGVIHRDIKPANVLRGADGVYKLTDFGLARSLEREQSLTASGSILGTLHYMAPEVVTGEEATAASDLYSLGVTLYEMLAGTTPFPDDSPLKLLRRIAVERPLPLRSHRDDIPPQFEAWLDRLLGHAPTDRFASAAAALDALRTLCLVRNADGPAAGDDTLMEIARELDVDSRCVRQAVVDHRAATAPPAAAPIAAAWRGAAVAARAAAFDPATRMACADAIDRLWLARVVGMGPEIPLLQLPICGLIGLGMGRRACRGALAACNGRFATVADLSGLLIGGVLCCFAFNLAAAFIRPLSVVSGLLGLVVGAMWLVAYWHELSGTAELLQQAAHLAVARRIRETRNWCVATNAALLLLVFASGGFAALCSAEPRTRDPFVAILSGAVVNIVALPVTWLLGWLFTLRPLALASRTLRGAGRVVQKPWRGAS